MSPYYLLIPVLLIALLLIFFYNRLVVRRNQVDYAFGSVDALLKKRLDLIPNLVASVKQYMTHERELLNRVTEMRARAMSGGIGEGERIDLEGRIGKTLAGIMVAVENYPQLKANQNVMHLQSSLNEVEEQISAARRFYNSAVTDFNNAIGTFPSNLVASMMGLQARRVFEIPEAERQAPSVGKLFSS